MAKKPAATKSKKTQRTYHYEIDGVYLEFTLTVDTSEQLRKYKTLLEMGLEDITQEIEGMKN